MTSFSSALKERQLKAGDKKDLKLKFEKKADKDGPYVIRVNMEEGGSVEVTDGGGRPQPTGTHDQIWPNSLLPNVVISSPSPSPSPLR